MFTLNQIKTLKFNIHIEIVEAGYSLMDLWKIEREDGLTTDTFALFCSDILEMLNNELICFGIWGTESCP
jgi:hypothetical protein